MYEHKGTFQVRFLERVDANSYRWPRKDDIAEIERKFMLSVINMATVTCRSQVKYTLEGNLHEELRKKYLTYQKMYFKKRKVEETPSVEVCHFKAPDRMEHFWPVDTKWQEELCKRHGLKLVRKRTSTKKEMTEFTPPARDATVAVAGDGNCYFRAISFWLTGSTEQHWLLREMIVCFMRDAWKSGERIMGKAVQAYLEEKKMASLGTWATETEIFATAELLRTSIHVWLKCGKSERWVPHHPSTGQTEHSIYLSNISQHFEPVTGV